jgi:SH3 domain-containing YSC84-like protein 1
MKHRAPVARDETVVKRSSDMTHAVMKRRDLSGLMTFGLGTAVLGAGVLGALTERSVAAAATSDQIELVTKANLALNEARHDPQFGTAADLFQSAKAVMVVPQLVKGGFFVGGEGGNAVLMARHGDRWSYPAFYVLASASFGLQIGLEVAEVVLFVMSDRALQAWMKNEVKLGGQAGLTVLVLGSNASAAATTHGGVDVIAWAKSKGAYAGITLEGSVITPRNEWTTAYYGRPLTPSQVLSLS